ncbi:hypothetical protein BDQ12DRAFT_631119 [Crucibulum laeve]|uniref:Uncharacterized protein n=1 Tax=Crucibulum laeve TaxID=68775 RepID=A0A5C3M060_9AGAR|nr:hypothetical protein BDQ12DRAFT_631119 [Crucibulum laeve]
MVLFKEPEARLNLDPGPPRRKSSSGCKCILWTIALLFVLFVALLIGRIVDTALKGLRHPHRNLFQNATLAEVASNLSIVVQPLVDNDQTFDIAATVWVREVEDEDISKDLEMVKETYKSRAIFSDIVLRGLRLKDKHQKANIQLQVPTDIFKLDNLTNYDLRGSFVLIPTSPSLLDNIYNYSSWIPASITIPSPRAWPFPPGSSDEGIPSIRDSVMDSFGISIPLIEFHNIRSRCTSENSSTSSQSSEGIAKPTSISPDDQAEDLEEDMDLDEEEITIPVGPTKSKSSSNKNKLSSTDFMVANGNNVLKNHPYIVTRTQLRVTDFTKLYNRKMYNIAHQRLKATSCGQGIQNTKPNWTLCQRNFKVNGNLETRIQLRGMNKTTGKAYSEWAYAPYMSVLNGGHGPLDLVPVPINRENCSINQETSELSSYNDREYVNITWAVSYSGRSPVKLVLGDFGAIDFNRNLSDTEHNLLLTQSGVELINSLRGHRFHEDAHPRRLFFFSGINTICTFALTWMQIHYWYTRSSTVGISVHGNALLAAGIFTDFMLQVREATRHTEMAMFSKLVSCLISATIWLPTLLSLIKAITRIEIDWWRSFIPIIRRSQATHRERASQRLDSQLPWHIKAITLLTIMGFFSFFASPDDFFLIQPTVKFSTHDDYDYTVRLVRQLCIVPFWLVGQMLQIRMNSLSRTFAGTYKLCVIVEIVVQLMGMMIHIPMIAGRVGYNRGLSLYQLLCIFLVSVKAWQATTFRSVAHTDDDNHSD